MALYPFKALLISGRARGESGWVLGFSRVADDGDLIVLVNDESPDFISPGKDAG
jgi:hypothetical protein